MHFLSYKFEQQTPKMVVPEFKLGAINLLAGLSGVGKTRILNTMHNLSLMIQKKRQLSMGKWNINFKIGKQVYTYFLHVKAKKGNGKASVVKEKLETNGKTIIDRQNNTFYYNDKKLPKLSSEDVGIYLLREEKEISAVFDEFENIYIRRMNPFFQKITSYEELLAIVGLPSEFFLEEDKVTTREIRDNYKSINIQTFLLKKHHPSVFSSIEQDFKEIFPFIQRLAIKPISEVKALITFNVPKDAFVPILVIKEKHIRDEIPIVSLSSGMLRALIQLVDIYTMPSNSTYLIDEIENSMGVRSFPAMLDILIERSQDIQLVFTTHHPYLFNNIPVKYWKVLSRKGSIVIITNGEELEEKFSHSHLDAFTQLINTELIENGI